MQIRDKVYDIVERNIFTGEEHILSDNTMIFSNHSEPVWHYEYLPKYEVFLRERANEISGDREEHDNGERDSLGDICKSEGSQGVIEKLSETVRQLADKEQSLSLRQAAGGGQKK